MGLIIFGLQGIPYEKTNQLKCLENNTLSKYQTLLEILLRLVLKVSLWKPRIS